jgi:hypothetical protein
MCRKFLYLILWLSILTEDLHRLSQSHQDCFYNNSLDIDRHILITMSVTFLEKALWHKNMHIVAASEIVVLTASILCSWWYVHVHRNYVGKSPNVGSDVLRAVVMKSTFFWDIMPCSPLKVCSACPSFFLGLFFDPEDGVNMFLWGLLSTNYMPSYHRR